MSAAVPKFGLRHGLACDVRQIRGHASGVPRRRLEDSPSKFKQVEDSF